MAEKDVIINMFDMFPDHKNHHNPLVFQCSKCMTIIGDSLSWKFSNEAQQIICLSRITQSINVDRDVHISQSNKQQMSTFSKLICQGCLTCIGRIYHSTSMDFDQFRGLYSLDAKRISCYKTGEDSNESIFNSLETADPVKYVLVSMDERLRAVEKKLGMTRGMMGNNDISVEETSNIHDSQQSESTLVQHADSQEERHSVSFTTTSSFVSS